VPRRVSESDAGGLEAAGSGLRHGAQGQVAPRLWQRLLAREGQGPQHLMLLHPWQPEAPRLLLLKGDVAKGPVAAPGAVGRGPVAAPGAAPGAVRVEAAPVESETKASGMAGERRGHPPQAGGP